MNAGTMCTKIVRISLQPTRRAETTKSSSRRAGSVRHDARQLRPSSSEMMMVIAK